MRRISLILIGAVGLLPLASCAGGPELASASDLIEMKRSGADDATLLSWVRDSSRTFDLDETDIADLSEAGVSEEVMDAMIERSEEHHEEGGSDEHEHEHEENH